MEKVLLFLCLGSTLFGQIDSLESELAQLQKTMADVENEIQHLKLSQYKNQLFELGLPTDDWIDHTLMYLAYDEDHEQAKWVGHVIAPEIEEGVAFRSNDFRIDPKVSTGTAEEKDYFLKYLQPDSTYEYDGFGYDRGHLAPSADFRWSAQALSESYFYSNMSPMLPAFNREGWADLENTLRGYVMENKVPLFVVTMPLLESNLPVLERSINQVSIPKYFLKIVFDPTNDEGLAFMMPNKAVDYPLSSYAISIDSAETITGYDFFNESNGQESKVNLGKWFPEIAFGDVEPMDATKLPRGHFNSVNAKYQLNSGKKVWVCGKVVSLRNSRTGNLWMNLDVNFPNQICSVLIRQEDLVNFSYQVKTFVEDKNLCFKGEVEEFNGVPTVAVDREKFVKLYSTH